MACKGCSKRRNISPKTKISVINNTIEATSYDGVLYANGYPVNELIDYNKLSEDVNYYIADYFAKYNALPSIDLISSMHRILVNRQLNATMKDIAENPITIDTNGETNGKDIQL